MDQPLRDDGATWELPWTVLVRRYSLLSTIAVEERWKGQVVGADRCRMGERAAQQQQQSRT